MAGKDGSIDELIQDFLDEVPKDFDLDNMAKKIIFLLLMNFTNY